MAPENLPLVSTYTIGWFDGLTPTDTKTYTYGNTSWPDLLTAYDGDSITYDAIGNPTSYRGASMTWSGRRLSSYSKSGVTVTYVYNESGIRTQKTVDGTTTEYFLSGSTILAEKTGSNITWYLYDSLGNPVGYEYGGVKYWYITNLQGDILYVVNSAGTPIGSYTYSPYGDFTATVLSSSDSTAFSANHLTYRGYYYDAETGLYYVSSRYYDAEVCRFINTDDVSLLGANSDLASYNLFAYCGNNPVIREDRGGQFWNFVIGATVGALAGGITAVISSYKSTGSINWGSVAIGVACGAISGLVGASGIGMYGQAAISGVTSALSNVGNSLVQGEKINWTDVAVDAVIGAGTSLIGSALTNKASEAAKQTIKKGISKIVTGKTKYDNGSKYWKGVVKKGFRIMREGLYQLNVARGTSSVIGSTSGGVLSIGKALFF